MSEISEESERYFLFLRLLLLRLLYLCLNWENMRYKNNVPVVFCGNGYIYIVLPVCLASVFNTFFATKSAFHFVYPLICNMKVNFRDLRFIYLDF